MDTPPGAQLAFVGQLSLGVVFTLSALPKLLRPREFVQRVVSYKILPASIARIVGWGLIPVEALLAAALLLGWQPDVALPLAAALLAGFSVAVGINLRRGRRVSCGCFGSATEMISGRSMARLLLLLCGALVLVIYASMNASLPSLGSGRIDDSRLAFAVVSTSLSAFLILVGIWLSNLNAMIALTHAEDRNNLQSSSAFDGPAAEGA